MVAEAWVWSMEIQDVGSLRLELVIRRGGIFSKIYYRLVERLG